MIPGFEAIVEERIKKAQKDGAFDKLPGAGKPLAFDEPNVPEELRMAHKILKNAGFLPPEIEVRKKIDQTRDLLAQVGADPAETDRVQKKLNFLLTKLDTMRGSGASLDLARDQYRNNLIKKLT